MAKQPKQETALVSPELQKSLDVIYQSKQEIDAIGTNCLQIKVVDESTLSVAQQNLSKANDMAKFIDAKRKEVKEPHLNNCKVIDATCGELTEVIMSAVDHLKSEIKAWELKRIEEANKAKLELERKQKEEADAIEKENKRKAGIQDYINNDLTTYLKNSYEKLDSAAACDKLINTLNTKWPGADKLFEFLEQGIALRNNYIDLIEIKKKQFIEGDNMSEDQKQMIAEREEIAKQKQLLSEREAKLKEKEALMAAEKAKKEAEERAKAEAEKLEKEAAANKTSGIRKTWKFELVDKSKVALDWIALDEKNVKEYLSNNKDKIKSGDVINGVKFYQEVNVSA